MSSVTVVQEEMEQQMAAFVTGLENVTRGLAEIRAHILGQFWSSQKGAQGAGRVPLATTGAGASSDGE